MGGVAILITCRWFISLLYKVWKNLEPQDNKLVKGSDSHAPDMYACTAPQAQYV